MNETQSLLTVVKKIKHELEAQFDQVRSQPRPEAVDQFRLQFLGRKGKITGLMEELKNAPKEERPTLGKEINVLRQQAEEKVTALLKLTAVWQVEQKLAEPAADISLPCAEEHGSLHPISLLKQELV